MLHDSGIKTVMVATDADDGENGRVSYRWSGTSFLVKYLQAIDNWMIKFADSAINAIFYLDADTGNVYLNSPLDRSKNSTYDVNDT